MTEVIKDIESLRNTTLQWQDKHDKQHLENEEQRRRDVAARKSGHRWIVGTVIGAIGLLIAILTLVFQLVLKVKGG
jgi:hypothetical protein